MNCFVTGRRRSRRGRARTIRFWNNSECASPIWTKIGTTKQLDTKNKPVMYFLKILKIDPTREGQRSKFLPIFWTRNNVSTCHSDSAGPTWTKIGTVKQIDPGKILCFLLHQKNNLGRAGAEVFYFLFFICLFFSPYFALLLCKIWVKMANF